MKTEIVNLSQVSVNEANPRKIKDDKFEKLVNSLLVLPKMLELRPIVVDNSMIALGGNMRYRALTAIADMTEAELKKRIAGIRDFQKKTRTEQNKLLEYWLQWKDKPTAPIIKASELTDAEKQEFIIKDNAGFGEWDWDALAAEWDTGDLVDWGVDVWQEDGFGGSEADNEEAKEDDFTDEDAKQAEARVKLGEIWQLGEHRLMCGDSTDSAAVAKLMDGQKADLVFTDPPYGMKKENEGVLNDNLNAADLVEFNKQWIAVSFDNLKSNGAWYCWGNDESLLDIYACILRPMIYGKKITFRNLITWDKGSGRGQNSEEFLSYPVASEKCLFVVVGAATMSSGVFRTKEFFFEGFSGIRDYLCEELKKSGLKMKDVIKMTSTSASHYFSLSQWAFPTEKDYNTLREYCKGAAFQKEYAELQKEYRKILPYFNNTHDNMNDVWHFERARYTDNESRTNDVHATPKPIALCARGIKSSSRKGESILDLFGGSGSTLIACEQTGRKCYMMELDPHYCDVIIARWEKFTGGEAVKIQ